MTDMIWKRIFALIAIELMIMLPIVMADFSIYLYSQPTQQQVVKNTATINWETRVPGTTTGKETSGWLDYDTLENFQNTGVLGKRLNDTGQVSIHEVILKDLLPFTEYVYDIGSSDNGTVRTTSGEGIDLYRFTTKEAADTTPPAILSIIPDQPSPDKVAISWLTDEESTTVVHYGTDETVAEAKSSSLYSTRHRMMLDVTEGGRYYYQAESCDRENNCAISNISFFVAGADIRPMFVLAAAPEFHNSKYLGLNGSTKPMSTLKFYVNGNLVRAATADHFGYFRTTLSIRKEQNSIKIEAISPEEAAASAEFDVTLDMEKPSVSLSPIPEISKTTGLKLNGSVDETSDVTVVVASAGDLTPPPRVTNLKASGIGSNSADIEWDEPDAEDIFEYAIYRDGVRIDTISTDSFSDSALDPSASYDYRVSAVDEDCNEGELSSALQVTTEEGTRVFNITPEEAPLTCARYLYEHTEQLTGKFDLNIPLREGRNNVKVMFRDRAGNIVSFENTTTVDTEKPVITEHNLGRISPSYTRDVTVRGKVSEPGKVCILVNKEEITGSTKCGDTDSEGSFNINVKLQRELEWEEGVAAGPSEEISGRAEYGPAWRNDMILIAVDMAGLKSDPVGPETVIYTQCGLGSWWQLDMGSPTPDMITPRLVIEGMAQIGISFGLEWSGIGPNGSIRNIYIQPRPLSLDEQEEWDLGWARPAQVLFDKRALKGYETIDIISPSMPDNWTMFQKEENISDHRLNEECLAPALGCIRVPLQLVIDFETPDYNYTLTQKQCWDVEVSIDRRIPPDMIPESFLNASIEFLTKSIELIEKVLEPLRKVMKVVLITCAITWVITFWYDWQVRWACDYSSKMDILGEKWDPAIARTGQCEDVYEDDAEQACMACQDQVKAKKDFKQYMHWACDRIFCPSAPTFQDYIKDAKSRMGSEELKVVEIGGATYGADTRSDCLQKEVQPVFGSGEKYDIKYMYEEFRKGSPKTDPAYTTYATQQAEKNCDDLHESNPGCCAYEYMQKWDSACLVMDELKESACLAAQAQNRGDEIPGCNRLWNSVAGFCDPDGKPVPDLVPTSIYYPMDEKTSTSCTNAGGTCCYKGMDCYGGSGECSGRYETVPNGICSGYGSCCRLNAQAAGKKNLPSGATTAETGIDSITGLGIIAPDDTDKILSYQAGKESQFGSEEYCTGNHRFRAGETPEIYYRILPPTEETGQQFEVHRGYITRNIRLKGTSEAGEADSPINEELVFRPVKDLTHLFQDQPSSKDIKTEKEKNEYMEKMDMPEEFLADIKRCSDKGVTPERAKEIYHEIRSKIGLTDKKYIVDPTSGLLRSSQCVCMPALTSYLNLYKSMFTAIRTCFQTIRLTGDGSPGVCEAVLSVYICDFIYDLLKCFVKKYGTSRTSSRSGDLLGMGNIFGALTQAGTDTVLDVRSRYGEKAMWKTMFAEKKLMHSICLFAFTGTWDFDIMGMLEQDMPIPVESQGFLYPCERRFVSFNPIGNPRGITTHVYHFGVGIVAGADLTYTLEMKCSGTPTCEAAEGFEQGWCDCRRVGPRTRGVSVGIGTLKAGEILNEEGDIYESMQDDVRYDSAVLSWQYKNAQEETVSDRVECRIKKVGGDPPAFCSFDYGSGKYLCKLDIGADDWVGFNMDPIPVYAAGRDIFTIGDPVRFEVDIQHQTPNPEGGTRPSTARDSQYTKYLQVRLFNQNSNELDTQLDNYLPIVEDGTYRKTLQLKNTIKKEDCTTAGYGTAEAKPVKGTPGAASLRGEAVVYDTPKRDVYYLYFVSGNTYEIYEDPEMDRKINDALPFSGGQIEYDGIRARIIGSPKKGDMIRVKYNPPRPSAKDTGKVRWKAVFAIYDAVLQHGFYAPSGTVSLDQERKDQREEIEFEVDCSAASGAGALGACDDPTVIGGQKEYCVCDWGPDGLLTNDDPYDCGFGLNPEGEQFKGAFCCGGSCSPGPCCPENIKITAENEDCICQGPGGNCWEGQYCYREEGQARRSCRNTPRSSTPPVIISVRIGGNIITNLENGDPKLTLADRKVEIKVTDEDMTVKEIRYYLNGKKAGYDDTVKGEDSAYMYEFEIPVGEIRAGDNEFYVAVEDMVDGTAIVRFPKDKSRYQIFRMGGFSGTGGPASETQQRAAPTAPPPQTVTSPAAKTTVPPPPEENDFKYSGKLGARGSGGIGDMNLAKDYINNKKYDEAYKYLVESRWFPEEEDELRDEFKKATGKTASLPPLTPSAYPVEKSEYEKKEEYKRLKSLRAGETAEVEFDSPVLMEGRFYTYGYFMNSTTIRDPGVSSIWLRLCYKRAWLWDSCTPGGWVREDYWNRYNAVDREFRMMRGGLTEAIQ